MDMNGHDHGSLVESRDLSPRWFQDGCNRVIRTVVNHKFIVRLIGSVGTRFHGWLVHDRTWLQGSIRLRLDSTTMALAGSGMMSMALAGLIMIGIHTIWVDSLDSDYGNLLVGIYHEFS
ncbi:hypothetical protein F2Q70_00028998 [Brassica cretica]|uniref:Uncharacterized protein n=1 Tax=Brassica cretica TaxID=69181 RepID=A0A8S9FFL2_BRACR|nr:hypothetical protein F2Q70_00028998 [Brassica cretica]